jgi:serine/threonine-protein kinase
MTDRTTVDRRCRACGERYSLSQRHSCAKLQRPDAEGASKDAAAATEFDPEDLVGAVLGGRYELLEPVGRGGMGVVYKARHTVLKSLFAVKVLLRLKDEQAERRFLLEAQLASKIHHANVVHISDFGVLDDGRSYLVMELLQGPTLSMVLDQGRLDSVRACQITLQILRGLYAIHSEGIFHRDLKPDYT